MVRERKCHTADSHDSGVARHGLRSPSAWSLKSPPEHGDDERHGEIIGHMQSAFGVSFADVLLLTDGEAAQRARGLGAMAYTDGRVIGFAPGSFAPASREGLRTIAHEFAHIVQARGGTGGERATTAPAPRAIEADADRAADRVLRGQRPHLLPARFGLACKKPESRPESPPTLTDPVTRMRFTGRTLTLEGNSILPVAAISGKKKNNHKSPDHRDHTGPSSEGLPDVGPIRQGSYKIEPHTVEHSDFDKAIWGPVRVRLQESWTTSLRRKITTKREGGFFVHQDIQQDGTAGCIGIQSLRDTQRVFERIEHTDKNIPVEVQYPTNVSVELEDAPAGDTPEERVSQWLKEHKSQIVAAEKRWNIDRRAIAGAIAWEGLHNVYSYYYPFSRFAGPGKVHYRESHVYEGEPVARQVEKRGALPARTQAGRRHVLSTAKGSITYIAAIMSAFADEASSAGYHLNAEPALLATFYNAWSLDKAHELFQTKKYPAPLAVNETMGLWVRDNLPYLEGAVGKPSVNPERPRALIATDQKKRKTQKVSSARSTPH